MIPVLVLVAFLGSVPGAGDPSFSHADWSELLTRHVADGKVDYEGLRTDRGLLDAYLARTAGANLAGWSGDERKAFWINVYNARMVEIILDHWPLESVLDIGKIVVVPTLKAFKIRFPAAGSDRSLDDVEHRILRTNFNDPRIHAAIVCASASCPVLASEAYDPEQLDAQLDAAMDGFLRDPSRNRIFDSPPRISKIFDWFEEDFRKESGSAWAYILGRLTVEERTRVGAPPPKHLDFDWSLNER